jgi:hypothetical protein
MYFIDCGKDRVGFAVKLECQRDFSVFHHDDIPDSKPGSYLPAMFKQHSFTDPVLAEYYPSTNNGLPHALIPRCLECKPHMEGLLKPCYRLHLPRLDVYKAF